jgi:hypothetical protein
MKELACLALCAALLTGCELWGAALPDRECRSLLIEPERELVISESLRHDASAQNAGRGAASLAAQVAELDCRALWQVLELEPPGSPAELPFRLLALVNRTDLAEQLAPESPDGEARLVYTLTRGPGDDSASPALPLTVIFEYSLGSRLGARDWASAFHELHSLDDTRALVRRFSAATAEAGAPRLSQVRVNDGRSGQGLLYELAPDDSGRLVRRGVRNTPRIELAATAERNSFVRANEAAVRDGSHRFPSAWLASASAIGSVTWLPDLPLLEHDFSRSTCGGCHGDDGPAERGFHLAEAPDGSVTLSSFLSDDDLPRRAAVARARLCAE